MAERDDGTPRRVPVVVEVRTFGRFCCKNTKDGGLCPFIEDRHATPECKLFGAELTEVTKPRDGDLLRVPACLALDEPDRSPAEAQAHGLGSQP